MPYQEDFGVEQFMDKYEEGIQHNLGETCCFSISLGELAKLSGNTFELDQDLQLTYGSIKGSDKLRSLIASMYGPEFNKDNVLVTNGAIAANFLIYYTLVGPGDHVICVDPTYAQLYSVPKMFGAEVSLLKLQKEDGFIPNIETLKKMIKSNTKLIIINNPNNPLGSAISTETLNDICQLCEENNIYLHCDEVYKPIFHSMPEGKSVPLSGCQLYDKAITTGSMSKAFSCAGLRLGWLISKDTQMLRDAASRRDYNTISVGMVDDKIAQYVLENREPLLKRNFELCLDNLQLLNSFIQESQGRFEYVCKPEAGTVCLLKLNGISDSMAFGKFIAEEYKILAVPGEAFGIPGTLRIGYGNSKKDLLEGLPLLQKAYDVWLGKKTNN
ncbi:hypothetical protein NCAS_0G04050 [Naumovozyma castellii]|uniref:Aminotransferase class I/classII large domain-containing protein n=1 Tax=Naumovozyma castellii TaxID=27288 RepID=G0VHI6_NAUCA|nr:hypothetical protein NCAS_0G04050 [Naumovozyma castellii CBS 4309]CCC71292.1 hypothetical protein NCAS_0G04050 [Naumovozyma castellii CBS 4309]